MVASRALVVHPYLKSGSSARTPDARLEEAVGLSQAIALEVRGTELVALERFRPSTLLGEGTVTRIGARIA